MLYILKILPCKLKCHDPVGNSHYHCPLCPWNESRKNRFLAHIKKHKVADPSTNEEESLMERQSCSLIDDILGIYLVSKSSKGPNIPLHVQKKKNQDQVLFLNVH